MIETFQQIAAIAARVDLQFTESEKPSGRNLRVEEGRCTSLRGQIEPLVRELRILLSPRWSCSLSELLEGPQITSLLLTVCTTDLKNFEFRPAGPQTWSVRDLGSSTTEEVEERTMGDYVVKLVADLVDRPLRACPHCAKQYQEVRLLALHLRDAHPHRHRDTKAFGEFDPWLTLAEEVATL